MTRIASALSIAGCMAVLTGHALAQDLDTAKGRYTMSPVEGGLLRLDTQTGAMSLCTRKAETWSCEPVGDKSASGTAAPGLDAENKALKDRVKQLEDEIAASGGGAPPAPKSQLPSEEDVDKALDYVERVFKKFRDRMRKYEQDVPPGDTGKIDPNTTPNRGDKPL